MIAQDSSLRGVAVRVASGDLAGTRSTDGEIAIFKGVPYARPPVGALRWRPPQPPEPWSGTRPADAFGPRCIQQDRPSNAISYFGLEKESEDCLYLNIWTATIERSARLPVMVWFHGGAFSMGSGALPYFDGEALARRGVVLVTVNYRLGGLGFLAHPELTRESATGSSGNWGLLDQIAALRWVRDNIASFGGDPNCVTIFGQSAGSSTGNYMMASAPARGLFHRVIGQSGGAVEAPGRPGGGSLMPLATAENVGLKVAQSFGRKSIAELRELPARDIQLAWPKDADCRPWPSIDGLVLSESPYDAFADGRQYDVPLLTGANAHEGSARPPAKNAQDWKAVLRRDYGDDAEALFQMYGGGDDVDTMSRRSSGHVTFNAMNWTWARQQVATGKSKVFFYHFGRIPPLPPDCTFFENEASRLGAFHTAEIPYVFDTLDKRPWPWREIDRALARMLSSYWVNFATHGDPNGTGVPLWPTFDPDGPTVLLVENAITAGVLPERKELDLWNVCLQHLRERRGR
ncbi:MAG TPA: carboxylesterase family protein [Beijerinckiaceae bacterium]|nr:carboxylesterase family protein [Beijerinckiaceae bacterium]